MLAEAWSADPPHSPAGQTMHNKILVHTPKLSGTQVTSDSMDECVLTVLRNDSASLAFEGSLKDLRRGKGQRLWGTRYRLVRTVHPYASPLTFVYLPTHPLGPERFSK